MNQPQYRPDIDGLRAVAVVSVILFHLGARPFSGGFVGVDIFFVISGYLITRIIVDAEKAGRFSYLGFYTRRARRLLPALLATIAVTFIVGATILLPEDFSRLSGSTVAAILAVTNIFYWNESGYFDVGSSLKPLLHTWSLAVEIQFYLIWPAFIIWLVRRKMVVAGISAAAIISFFACIYVMTIAPTTAFYFTPFRVFEFAIGGLVTATPRIRSARTIEGVYVAGLAAILWCVFRYTDSTSFPGWTALLPCFGTALAIYAGNARSSVLLCSRPAVWVGRISYSLYLVHWPLIVFARYGHEPPIPIAQQSALLACTFILAVVSFYAIEAPFRKQARRAVYVMAATVAVLISSTASQSLATGWPWRFSEGTLALYTPDRPALVKYVWANHVARSVVDDFRTPKTRILIVGDSQAADLTNMFVEAGEERTAEIITRTVYTECGIPYLPPAAAERFMTTINPMTTKDRSFVGRCLTLQKRFIESKALASADYVVVSYFWRDFELPYIDGMIAEIKSRTHAKLVLVGTKAFSSTPAQMAYRNGGLAGLEQFAYAHRDLKSTQAGDYIRSSGEPFLDVMQFVCPRAGFCNVLTDDGKPIYFELTHLTQDGARFLAKPVAETFESIITTTIVAPPS
ncbi:acyltransferase [Mesorhizobium sp. CO1-1-2]|uniref:acyltransferase family protein n=1 Tax=Mesorhizobium sp. CO1-1-2 TaxID=2876635 RepID=UPI001CCBB277|nr:acyltransferase family protein [Mesorhizobium sp. CO1-1-2]MBZ9683125.1 acyltransferase [Mesorhizobium sp. CO1-1-2]